ncbi:hypothetical protein ACFL17_07915, partial [Pseudomonadota bacterium]
STLTNSLIKILNSKLLVAALAATWVFPVIAMDKSTISINATAHDAILKQSTNYILSLKNNCTRTDGYKCMDKGAIENLKKTLLPGNYLKAWSICYQDFLNIQDLTEEQKQLRHYNIRITEDKEHYVIEFQGLLLPYVENGRPVSVLTGIFGRETRYWVNKDTYAISKRLFYK